MNVIKSLDDLADRYDIILSDVWGVVHNGERAFPAAAAALTRAREAGKRVILITNSPRPRDGVILQLGALGVPTEAYDAVVTSGDVTRILIEEAPRRVFHIGGERDLPLYDGTHAELVEEQEAQVIVCTGLFDDENETPDDYVELLARLRSRNLPMICANPDIVVERGERMIWCAGALARDYGLLGGRTLVAGKPHAPIYKAAMKEADLLNGAPVDKSRVVAVGDGLLTDVKGAVNNGFGLLYISSGIHAKEYGEHGRPDHDRLEAWLKGHGVAPVAVMPWLV